LPGLRHSARLKGSAMRCVGYGLNIRTVVPIPGAMAATTDAPVDVEVDYGTPPPWPETVAWGPYRVRDVDRFDFTMPNLARYTITDRRRITISPERGADETLIAAMLVATALPVLLWARGDTVLHAAAASGSVDGPGWLILGDSGSGKSSRLVKALRSGAYAIADDSVRLRLEGDRVLASGLPGGVFSRASGPDDPRVFLPTPVGQQLRECPVAMGQLIEPDGGARNAVGLVALTALLRHRHRPRILGLLGIEAAAINPLARIAKSLRLTG